MTKDNPPTLPFASLSSKKVVVDFDGGTQSSDGGVLFLHEVEQGVGVIRRLARVLRDRRHPSYVDHSPEDLLRQRVFQITCGYEDANDSNNLRRDPALKVACDRLPISGEELTSQPTISRLGGRAEGFIKNHKRYLHSDRTSCHSFQANQFRLFLHSAAYVLLHTLAEKGLKGTEWAKAQFDTIQKRILKVGARVHEMATRIRFHLPTSFPLKPLFATILRNLAAAFP